MLMDTYLNVDCVLDFNYFSKLSEIIADELMSR